MGDSGSGLSPGGARLAVPLIYDIKRYRKTKLNKKNICFNYFTISKENKSIKIDNFS